VTRLTSDVDGEGKSWPSASCVVRLLHLYQYGICVVQSATATEHVLNTTYAKAKEVLPHPLGPFPVRVGGKCSWENDDEDLLKS
jgi:hypothetical protein